MTNRYGDKKGKPQSKINTCISKAVVSKNEMMKWFSVQDVVLCSRWNIAVDSKDTVVH